MRKKDKGFTLIELLVTIAITVTISAVGIITVNKILDVSKEKKQEISITNIKKSASQYTEEFKTSDKYWNEDSTKENTEYACTTVGMLINKGFLKEDILDTEIVVEKEVGGIIQKTTEKVKKDTSIKIDRASDTKVYNFEEIIFGSNECSEGANVNLNFEVSCSESNNNCKYGNWFNDNVKIKINATELEKIQAVNGYKIKIGDGNLEYFTPYQKNGEKTADWNIIVGNEGKKIDICVDITNVNDKDIQFCISKNSLIYNMDKTAPSAPKIEKDRESTEYKLVSSSSSDNITDEKDLVYYFSKNEDTSLGKAEWIVPNDTRTSNTGEVITSYVVDAAGNKSDITTKNLIINSSLNGNAFSNTTYTCSLNPSNVYDNEASATSNCSKIETGTVTSNTTYTCSLDTSKTYTTKASATNNCSKTETGTVSSKTTYTCSLDTSKTYTTKATATSNCSKTETGTVTSETTYSCPDGGTRSGTKCYKTTTKKVTGGGTYTLKCDGGRWYDQGNYNFTNYDCPSGYYKVDWDCTGCVSPCGSSCSSSNQGKTQTYRESCYNICEKTSTYNADATTKYYCSYYPSTSYTTKANATNACEKTTTGTVTSTTKYYCSLNPNTSYTTEDNAKNHCSKTTTGSVTSTTKYYCSLNPDTSYTTENNAKNNCSKTTTGSVTSTTKHYCDLFNEKEYPSLANAQEECSNYCASGYDFYNGGCYRLVETESE